MTDTESYLRKTFALQFDMHKNTEKLRVIMRTRKLSTARVAEITSRTKMTVGIWRCKSDNRVIPDELLRLVELETSPAVTQGSVRE